MLVLGIDVDTETGTEIDPETGKNEDKTVPVALSVLKSLSERLQKAEEINQKMLTVILEQSEHIRYLEAMSRVKRI